MLIILFNVLVALVGQAFDEEINLEAITVSEQRAQLNLEYRELRKNIAKYLPSWKQPAIDFLVCSLEPREATLSGQKGLTK